MPQCKPSRGRKRGICWCVDKYGVQLPGTDYSGGDIQCKDLESSNNNEWKSGRDHLRQPRPPPPPPLTTTWPRARASSLNHTCMLRPPFTSRSLVCFFFSNRKKKKEEEKRKSKTKEQAEQKTPVFYFFLFFILFFCRRPSTHLRMRGEKKSQKISPSVTVTVAPVDLPPSPPSYEAGPLAAGSMKIYAPNGYIFYRSWGFQYKTLCMM